MIEAAGFKWRADLPAALGGSLTAPKVFDESERAWLERCPIFPALRNAMNVETTFTAER